MSKKKVILAKMGTRTVGRKKNEKFITQKERNAKKKKALEEWKQWFS